MEELTKQCPYCGQTINAAAIKCKYCGRWLETFQSEGPAQSQTPPPPPPPQQNYQQQYTQQPNYQQPPTYVQQNVYAEQPRKSNGLGIAGFVLALLGVLVGWVPIIGWIFWILGLIFSFIGIFKVPRGLAIAGLVLSLLGLLIIVGLTGGFLAAVNGAMELQN